MLVTCVVFFSAASQNKPLECIVYRCVEKRALVRDVYGGKVIGLFATCRFSAEMSQGFHRVA